MNKICVVGRTFAAHCGGLITIRSYKDTSVKTCVDVLVFAHGPHKRSTLTAHGIEPLDWLVRRAYTKSPGILATPRDNQYFNISVASFEGFSDTAGRLTARICTLLIGAHGPHFIERYYRSKG